MVADLSVYFDFGGTDTNPATQQDTDGLGHGTGFCLVAPKRQTYGSKQTTMRLSTTTIQFQYHQAEPNVVIGNRFT